MRVNHKKKKRKIKNWKKRNNPPPLCLLLLLYLYIIYTYILYCWSEVFVEDFFHTHTHTLRIFSQQLRWEIMFFFLLGGFFLTTIDRCDTSLGSPILRGIVIICKRVYRYISLEYRLFHKKRCVYWSVLVYFFLFSVSCFFGLWIFVF